MPYYVPLDTAAVRILGGRNAEADALTIEYDSKPVLPVFTSRERFRKTFRGGLGEAGRVKPLATYPFGLAEMAARMEERGVVVAIAFDPVQVSPKRWKSQPEPIPVGEYLRFIEEVRPRVERMTAESTAKFGIGPPGSEAFAKALRWQMPRVKTMVDDARARMSEWDA